ncbi:hypothetical protein AAG906_003634 [Vitis piasezkii]
MSNVMLVVSAEKRNIALLQPQASSDDTTINYFFQCGWVFVEEVCVSLEVKEKPTTGSRIRNYNNVSLKVDGYGRQGVFSLIPGHGNPLSEHHCREVGLILVNCKGLILLTYSFNGEWLAMMCFFFFFFQTSGQEIHVDLFGREYKNVIDGEDVTITNLKAKFVPRG